MPNTNNALEGTFTALKNSLENHNGMSKETRKRFMDGFLKAWDCQTAILPFCNLYGSNLSLTGCPRQSLFPFRFDSAKV
jgi:hypothetical protein